MANTRVTGNQVKDNDIGREDLNVDTTGKAVVRKLIQGTGVTLSSTGVDAGTGDVTINADGGSAGHVIEEEGVDLTSRDTLNFVGAGITASDDATNLKTKAWVDFNIHSTSIPVGQSITIPAGTASIVAGAILIEGELILNGVMVVL